MATTGIYWCLVLTECLSFLVLVTGQSVVSFNHTPYPVVCPGDRLVFTCVVEGTNGAVAWKNNQHVAVLTTSSAIPLLDDFTLSITSYDNGVLVSAATNLSVPVQLNGSPPITPYQLKLLILVGIRYQLIVLQYGGTMKILQHYVLLLSITLLIYNVTDTNTTITGLSPINEYYTVTIIPVNVIGYGPSVTVNVSITTTTSSITNIMMSTTEYITTQDKSSAMTALPTITETQLITTTETISSCADSSSSCVITTMSQSTDVGSISVIFLADILMATTGIYWCLVLTDLFLLSSGAELVQTSPSYYPICPNDELVLTCVASGTGNTFWRNDSTGIASILNNNIRSTVRDAITLNVISIMDNTVTSTGTLQSVGVSMNGTMISCTASLQSGNYATFTITLTGSPVSLSIVNITFNPINNSALTMSWSLYTQDYNCSINEYNITIYSNETIIQEDIYQLKLLILVGIRYQLTVLQYGGITLNYNVTDTNTTITGLSPINDYYTVTIIPVNVIGYGPLVTVNVSITTTTSSITNIMMSTTEYITTQDKSSTMTALPTITETQLITTTETIISSYIESYSSCITTTMLQSTDVGSISVAIAVPITGLLTGLITAIITSIIVCLIMKKRGTAIQNKTPVGGGGEAAVIGPIYDLPTINTEQQEQIIDTKLNTAYGQTNI
uniref:Ig-like domain-containing protein n=1 Tax=Amphimedon queenslandica TaxID=400682 RepID=A0A1X7UFN5_AMPQE